MAIYVATLDISASSKPENPDEVLSYSPSLSRRHQADARGRASSAHKDSLAAQLQGGLAAVLGPILVSWSPTERRHFFMYTMFILVETRSVMLNAMMTSVLQLYLGARSRVLNVAIFAFVNFWQQVGVMIFLFSGSFAGWMKVELTNDPKGSKISGSAVLLGFIAAVTVGRADF